MSEAAVMLRGNAVEKVRGMQTDGRNRRAAETRRKIIEAARAMIEETSEAPTVVGVAKRADVSVRSVFQHFGDVQSLFVTVVDSVANDIVVAPRPAVGQPLSDRVQSLVHSIGEIFDKIVPLRVAAGQFVGHPVLLERGLAMRQQLRQATFEVFAPEFAALSPEARQELADAIGAALSLDAWIVLRRRDSLSLERAEGVWRLTLTALLEHGFAGSKD